ncbi:MAG: hypothetical protein K0Q75_2426, partial [Anaerospora sp.]|nr:hypothetical protein [Anaerospora sp.]
MRCPTDLYFIIKSELKKHITDTALNLLQTLAGL